MKCSRCKKEVGSREDFMVLYPRYSDGRKLSYFLCTHCIPDFAAFMGVKTDGSVGA